MQVHTYAGLRSWAKDSEVTQGMAVTIDELTLK